MSCRNNKLAIIAIAVAAGLLLSLLFGGWLTFLLGAALAVAGILLMKR